MTIKEEFVLFLNELMDAAPQVVETQMNDSVKASIDALASGDTSKEALTDNGKIILKYMQDTGLSMYKSKDIGAGLSVPSRNVSGSMRKLVSDGFVDKIGKDPVVYMLTDKGKNFIIED